MTIGIIIHSSTGTTLEFGKRIAAELELRGHQSELVRLQTDQPVHSGTLRFAPPFQIINQPDGSEYDALIVGCPVWAFSVSPVLYRALKGLKHIEGKKVVPIVTMGFPLKGMGGNQAIKCLGKELMDAGAVLMPGCIIPKMFHNFNRLMTESAQKIAGYFE